MRHIKICCAALALVALVGCHRNRPTGPRPDADLLTLDEIREHHFTNAYDAVASLRAQWLTVRGTDSFQRPSQIWVYFDQTRMGGVSELRAITVNSLAYIRHYNGLDATTRWGVDHGAGVIFVSSRAQ